MLSQQTYTQTHVYMFFSYYLNIISHMTSTELTQVLNIVNCSLWVIFYWGERIFFSITAELCVCGGMPINMYVQTYIYICIVHHTHTHTLRSLFCLAYMAGWERSCVVTQRVCVCQRVFVFKRIFVVHFYLWPDEYLIYISI